MSTKFQEEVMLPSKGLAYPQGYIPEGKVVISMMGTQEEKILAGGKMNFNTMLTTILDRLIVSPKIESSKLLTLDRMFLLIKIRVLSLGSKYSFKMKCSECGEESEFEVELAELEIKDFPDNWTEPLACHLPILDEEIKLRLLRATDEVDVDRYVQKLRAKNARLFQQGDPTYIPLMAKAVVSTSNLEESSLFQDKIAWVQELKSRDSIAIQDTLSDNDFGVVMQTEVTCPVCGAELDGVNIGLDPSFFAPAPVQNKQYLDYILNMSFELVYYGQGFTLEDIENLSTYERDFYYRKLVDTKQEELKRQKEQMAKNKS